MQLASYVKRVLKRVSKDNDQGQSRGDEQRDRSSMADFVRILQNQDNNRSG